MAEDQDNSQKTEDPTQHKLEEARKKGDVAKSQDVPIWFLILATAAIMAAARMPREITIDGTWSGDDSSDWMTWTPIHPIRVRKDDRIWIKAPTEAELNTITVRKP